MEFNVRPLCISSYDIIIGISNYDVISDLSSYDIISDIEIIGEEEYLSYKEYSRMGENNFVITEKELQLAHKNWINKDEEAPPIFKLDVC
jgi:hypothetical protein